MMRAAARLVRRAALPVRHTRGFNPHPVLSLPCPRPVGVASRDELLVLDLAPAPQPQGGAEMLLRLNAAAVTGMRAKTASPLPPRAPAPRRVAYEVPLPAAARADVARRIDALAACDTWPAQRAGKRRRQLDLRRLVERLEAGGEVLRWRQVPDDDVWARPGEVLRLVGLDAQTYLARVVRTEVDYGLQDNHGAADRRANGN